MWRKLALAVPKAQESVMMMRNLVCSLSTNHAIKKCSSRKKTKLHATNTEKFFFFVFKSEVIHYSEMLLHSKVF